MPQRISNMMLTSIIFMLALLHARAEYVYVYMGGNHDFAPFGYSDNTLPLEMGETKLMPVDIPPSHTLQLSALFDTPPGKGVDKGIGFALKSIGEKDTTTLLLSVKQAHDHIYGEDSLQVSIKRGNSILAPINICKASEPCLHEKDCVFTLTLSDNGECRIFGGSNQPTPLWHLDTAGIIPHRLSGVGFATAKNAAINVDRATLITASADTKSSESAYTEESIHKIINSASDPYTGYWSMLDYNLDSSMLRPGGEYILALIPDNSAGYEIVYISGATTGPMSWQCGNIKGRLKPTQLAGLYRVEWIDAEHSLLPESGYWQFLDTEMSQITFSALNSTLRMHRIRP